MKPDRWVHAAHAWVFCKGLGQARPGGCLHVCLNTLLCVVDALSPPLCQLLGVADEEKYFFSSFVV